MTSDLANSTPVPNPERRVRGRGLQPGQAAIPAGRVPVRGVDASASPEPPPRRLRRLPRIWTDRDGIVSFLLTICIQDRAPVLANEATFDCVSSFLVDSPPRYDWWPRRFVIMPDHIHLIARQGIQGVTLGDWIKAFKAMACRPGAPTGRSVRGEPGPSGENLARSSSRTWRWQKGFHDHKFRTAESEARKWEYICLNPVRAGLVTRPELWHFSGEFVYEPDGKSRLVRGTPPLLDRGVLIPDEDER